MQDEQNMQAQFAADVQRTLGPEKISALSERQAGLLDSSLLRLFAVGKWTDDEILGSHEMITEHVSPTSTETAFDYLETLRTKN